MMRAVLENVTDNLERFTGSLQHLREKWAEVESLAERTKVAKADFDEATKQLAELKVEVGDAQLALVSVQVERAKEQEALDAAREELRDAKVQIAAIRSDIGAITQKLNAA